MNEKSKYDEERRRIKALVKELRWHRQHAKSGHGFKARHKDRHRGCRKDSF